MKARQILEAELAKTRGMSRRDRIDHFVRYYWMWAVGVIGGFLFIVYLLFHAFFTVKDHNFYLVLVNAPFTDGATDALREDFASWAGYDMRAGDVFINDASYFDASISGGTNNSYFQSFVAVTEAGDLDAVVMGRANLEAVGSSGRLMDLAADENADLFAPYASRFVYCTPYDEAYSTEPVPVGIDIGGTTLAETYLYGDDCVLGVGAYTKRPEEVVRFLEYIGVD